MTLVASMLAAASGCDKASAVLRREEAPPVVDQLDLSTKPDILFQVFGDPSDLRLLPIAAIIGGKPTPIGLSPDGWRRFDEMYTRSPVSYPVYRDGRSVGAVRIRQGMWEKPEPVYALPQCVSHLPLASVALGPEVQIGSEVELLASTSRLASPTQISAPVIPDLAARARALGALGARMGSLAPSRLDRLEQRAQAVSTGAGAGITVVASFMDPQLDSKASDAETAHLFVIGLERDGALYPAFAHSASGRADAVEYRRFLDHLDLNGDGVDEIVLEGWQRGGETSLIILALTEGEYREIFRSRSRWCLDEPAR